MTGMVMRPLPAPCFVLCCLALSYVEFSTDAFVVQRWSRRPFPATTHFHRTVVSASYCSSKQDVVIEASTVLDLEVQSQIAQLIRQRAEARWKGDYALADELKKKVNEVQLPDHFRIAMADTPRGDGGGSSWSLVYEIPVAAMQQVNRSSVLTLAHSALGMAVSCAERGVAVPMDQLNATVSQAKEQLLKWSLVDRELRISSEMGKVAVSFEKLVDLATESRDNLYYWNAIETELSGRKAADSAFWFAIAGATDNELFLLLTNVCVKELDRFGDRPSCRPKDLLAIVERLAAAGIKDDESGLESVVRRCLKAKSSAVTLPDTLLDLHSDYCALMIWNFSTRQRKQRSFLMTAAQHWEEQGSEVDSDVLNNSRTGFMESPQWSDLFDDPNLPLVVDVGCGMGVSLLGLASLEASACTEFNWADCNFIGVDLSPLTINYAKSIARRWTIDRRLAFVVDSADRLLERLESYPGSIKHILIQFPTPYRLQSSLNVDDNSTAQNDGNSQLPKTVDDGFMVAPTLLRRCASLLRPSQGQLLLQSNCEDVAVWMRQTACQEAAFVSLDTSDSVVEVAGTPTQRTLNWIAMGGERASGTGWSKQPVLPPTGRTETEIACVLNGTPVHRCVLIPKRCNER